MRARALLAVLMLAGRGDEPAEESTAESTELGDSYRDTFAPIDCS